MAGPLKLLRRLGWLLVVTGLVVVGATLTGAGAMRLRAGGSAVAQVRELRLEPELRFYADVNPGASESTWMATTYSSDLPPPRVEQLVRERLVSAGYEIVDDAPLTLTTYASDDGVVPAGFPPDGAMGDWTQVFATRPGDGRRIQVVVGDRTPTWIELVPD